MATIHESSIEVIRSGVWEQESTRRDEELLNMSSVYSEETPLLLTSKLEHPTCYEYMRTKFKRLTFLKSKSAILILIWSFLAGVLHWAYTDPNSIITPLVILKHFQPDFLIVVIGSMYVYFAILQLFYPLAGYLADVRCGRYKCVVGSFWCFVGSSIMVGVGVPVGFGLCFMYPANGLIEYKNTEWLAYTAFIVITAFLVPPVVIGIFLFFSSIVAFNANVIQFGLDQLHDAPTEHLVLFIHWYVVLSYSGTELIRASASTLTSVCSIVIESDTNNYWITIIVLVLLLLLVSYVCLVISLCVASRKCRAWFLSDSSSRNPYGLVYRVIGFAKSHKTPIQRSAFTYCEEELPSRLDLGKAKYGGPFTTEQVEDVKVFLGILKLLLTLGPLFAVERSNNFLLQVFFTHLVQHTMYSCSLLSNDILPSAVIIFLLILYIVLVRSFVSKCIPGILKRVGLGMVLMIIPILCFFTIDTVYHKVSPTNPGCFLRFTGSDDKFNSTIIDKSSRTYFLLIPISTGITGSIIFQIAIYEFIYSQSPHSMKGLMFGTFFAIRGVFQLLGALMFIFPFLDWNTSTTKFFPSCGFVYFLINMIAALFGIIAYIWVSRKYQYRQRDEPDNVYRYAEEYYSKAQDEPDYDYDDYDNLNVHTIG